MNILLVEDNKKQLDFLYKKIDSKYMDIRVFKAETLREGLALIQKYTFDIFFIDIILKDGSGQELAEKLRSMVQYKFVPLVFCTTEYSLITSSLKKYHCYDFVVKPFKIEEIYQIIDVFIENNGGLPYSNHIFIEIEKGCKIKINLNDIIFIETIGKDIIINTVKNKYTLKNKSLSTFLQKLQCSYLKRCHKSYAVNMNEIKCIERVNTRTKKIHFLKLDTVIYVSSTYIDTLKEHLQSIMV